MHPDINQLEDPLALPDMRRAVETVLRTGRAGQKIVIYGDYDVDGVTSIAMLLGFFRLAGYEVEYYIPHRLEEGYGINESAIREIARGGASLLLTVDCGTSDHENVALARELGMMVVITDHHEAGGSLPEAEAVVNPKVSSSEYPFRDLAGVGVAFKLMEAMSRALSTGFRKSDEFREFLVDAVGLVALGTISDVAPLTGENRVFACVGLDALRACENPGLVALMRSAGLANSKLSSGDIGFRIGPRINAAGRLGESRLGVELLTTRSGERAREIASALERANRERQEIGEEILKQARERIEREVDLREECAIVLSDPRWHQGVIGIVGSRLVETFHRPVILVAENEEFAKGSGRSIPGVPIHECLSECSDVLISHGGHAMAAGLEMETRRIGDFRKQFLESVAKRVVPEDLVGTINIDCEVPLSAVTRSLVDELSLLEPCGYGNSQPVLLTRGVRFTDVPRRVGKRGEHLQFHVNQGRTTLAAVAFGMGEYCDEIAALSDGCSLAYTPGLNSYQGLLSVQLVVKDVQPRNFRR